MTLKDSVLLAIYREQKKNPSDRKPIKDSDFATDGKTFRKIIFEIEHERFLREPTLMFNGTNVILDKCIPTQKLSNYIRDHLHTWEGA